jgi:hypothetical protein
MNPTKEEIEEALWYGKMLSERSASKNGPYQVMLICLAAAYREAVILINRLQCDYMRDTGARWEPDD